MSRPGRRVDAASESASPGETPPGRSHSSAALAGGRGRRNPRAARRPSAPPARGCRAAGDATNRARAGRSAARPLRAQGLRRFQRLRASRSSTDRGELWAGIEPATPRLRAWCSTSELPRTGPAPVPTPYTEHAPPIVGRRGGRAAGLTGPAARLQRDAGGSRTHFGPGCNRPPGRLAPASWISPPSQFPDRARFRTSDSCDLRFLRFAIQTMSPPGVEPGPRPSHGRMPPAHPEDAFVPKPPCPRQESNLVCDLRRVACRPSHSKGHLSISRGARIRTLCAGFGGPLLSQEHTPSQGIRRDSNPVPRRSQRRVMNHTTDTIPTRKGRDSNPHAPAGAHTLATRPGQPYPAPFRQPVKWTAGELNPDLRRAGPASSRWTSSPG